MNLEFQIMFEHYGINGIVERWLDEEENELIRWELREECID